MTMSKGFAPRIILGERYFGIEQGAEKAENGMAFLRNFFPTGECNRHNLILFSTSGMHGPDTTIEQIEDDMEAVYEDSEEPDMRLTYLIIQPLLVSLIFGNCLPKDKKDLDWLKALRQSSQEVMMKIGMSY